MATGKDRVALQVEVEMTSMLKEVVKLIRFFICQWGLRRVRECETECE